ncbi:MAG: hypothetical protein MUE69_28075 [Myxococcota bacterium]|nr:hypothetical protein [Myxococcota bacterium]
MIRDLAELELLLGRARLEEAPERRCGLLVARLGRRPLRLALRERPACAPDVA